MQWQVGFTYLCRHLQLEQLTPSLDYFNEMYKKVGIVVRFYIGLVLASLTNDII